MKTLLDLYRAVCEAWPLLPQPCLPSSNDGEWHIPNVEEPCWIPKRAARLICGAAWAEKVMRDDPHTMTFEFYRGEFWCFRRGMCDEDLNEVSSGPDLCEAAANALVALARTTSP